MASEDLRSDPRSHVFLMAVLYSGPVGLPVRVRNLSGLGALLEGANLPPESRTVSLKRGGLAVAGTVAWSTGEQCGLRFSSAIKVAEWVDRAGSVGQQRIDATIADFRRTGTSGPRAAARVHESDRDSLSGLSANLLKVCDRLAGLPEMSVVLAEELIKIEAAANALAAIARRSA